MAQAIESLREGGESTWAVSQSQNTVLSESVLDLPLVLVLWDRGQ